MNPFDHVPDDIERRIADDRPPLPADLRPRVLAAVGQALASGRRPSRAFARRPEDSIILTTSIVLASLAFLFVVPSLVAQPRSTATIHSRLSPLESQARRLGIEITPPPSRPMALESSIVAAPSRPVPPILTPADVHRFLSTPF